MNFKVHVYYNHYITLFCHRHVYMCCYKLMAIINTSFGNIGAWSEKLGFEQVYKQFPVLRLVFYKSPISDS